MQANASSLLLHTFLSLVDLWDVGGISAGYDGYIFIFINKKISWEFKISLIRWSINFQSVKQSID